MQKWGKSREQAVVLGQNVARTRTTSTQSAGAAPAQGVPARELRPGGLHGHALQPLPLRQVLAHVRSGKGRAWTNLPPASWTNFILGSLFNVLSTRPFEKVSCIGLAASTLHCLGKNSHVSDTLLIEPVTDLVRSIICEGKLADAGRVLPAGIPIGIIIAGS